jgi:hypothetical protein
MELEHAAAMNGRLDDLLNAVVLLVVSTLG